LVLVRQGALETYHEEFVLTHSFVTRLCDCARLPFMKGLSRA